MRHSEPLELNIIVGGIPRTKDRPRARIAGYGKKQFIAFYNTKEVERAEDEIRRCAIEAINEQQIPMFETAISVEVMFYVPIPKSFSGIKTVKANAGDILPVTKPDLDNYVKLVMDAMNKVVYKDDNLVVDIIAKKRYSDNPGTMIIVKGIEF